MPSQTFNKRRLVGILPERITNVSDTEYPGHYPNKDFSWNLSKFEKKLNVKIQRLSNRSIEFDIVGVDASVANAFRRILLAEVCHSFCRFLLVYFFFIYRYLLCASNMSISGITRALLQMKSWRKGAASYL